MRGCSADRGPTQRKAVCGRLGLNDGSCLRLRAGGPNPVWSHEFVQDRTNSGRKFRMFCVIDEFTLRRIDPARGFLVLEASLVAMGLCFGERACVQISWRRLGFRRCPGSAPGLRGLPVRPPFSGGPQERVA